MKLHQRLILAAIASTSIVATAPAIAQQQITVNYDVNTGPVNPNGTAPWMQAILTDITGGVQIDIVGQFSSTNFVSEIAFNLVNDSQTYLNTLVPSCTPLTGTTACNTNDIFTAKTNQQSLNNFKGFDLTFFLPPPQGGPENTLGAPPDAVRFTLLGQGLDVTDFVALDSDLSLYYTMAKIQSITGSTETSTSITTSAKPTPTPFSNGNAVPGPLAIAGALTAFAHSRRLRGRIKGAS